MEAKILQMCREVNPDVPDDLSVKLFDEGYIDSFGAYMILAQLELEFDIRIDEDEMNYDNFQDMHHILELTRTKMEMQHG